MRKAFSKRTPGCFGSQSHASFQLSSQPYGDTSLDCEHSKLWKAKGRNRVPPRKVKRRLRNEPPPTNNPPRTVVSSPVCRQTKKEKPSASARMTSPRRAGQRRLGGTATEARREGRGTEEVLGGLRETLDLGATRYRDFQRNRPGGSRTRHLLGASNNNYLPTKERRRDQRAA